MDTIPRKKKDSQNSISISKAHERRKNTEYHFALVHYYIDTNTGKNQTEEIHSETEETAEETDCESLLRRLHSFHFHEHSSRLEMYTIESSLRIRSDTNKYTNKYTRKEGIERKTEREREKMVDSSKGESQVRPI